MGKQICGRYIICLDNCYTMLAFALDFEPLHVWLEAIHARLKATAFIQLMVTRDRNVIFHSTNFTTFHSTNFTTIKVLLFIT